MTENQLKCIALHLLIAGRDSTRTLLGWFFYDLSVYPEVRRKIYEEVDALELPQGQPPEYKLVSNFANGLQYMECCLAETLRLHPAVTMFTRFARRDVEIPQRVLFPDGKGDGKKYVIRKGEMVEIHTPTVGRSQRLPKSLMPFVIELKREPNIRLTAGLRTDVCLLDRRSTHHSVLPGTSNPIFCFTDILV